MGLEQFNIYCEGFSGKWENDDLRGLNWVKTDKSLRVFIDKIAAEDCFTYSSKQMI